ncbi:MAG: hypothetical protein ACO1RT_10255 [Planctomycetaceae bacterium]
MKSATIAVLIAFLMGWVIVLSIGCTVHVPGITPAEKPYPWRHRATAEISLAAVETTPAPDVKPVAGSKCPSCNDPPGACGVGKTGDGRDCDTCGTCMGDGRVDAVDLTEFDELRSPDLTEHEDASTAEPESPSDAGETVVELPKVITLHMTRSTQAEWANKWYAHERKAFEDRGWAVRAVLEPDGSIEAAYFDVQCPDGRTPPKFYTPLTIADIEALEAGG